MAASTPLPSNIKINKAPETATTTCNELRISGFYINQVHSPDPNSTHETIVKPNGSQGFGATVATDWTIHDGPDPSVNAVVARAQGLNMRSGNSYGIFNMIFENEWFKGSTLQVMGVGIDVGDQWAIIGGTGHFTMAQGYINKKVHKNLGAANSIRGPPTAANIIELDIYAIFRQSKGNLKTEGPKGGSGGQEHEPAGVPYRLESIKVRESSVIDSIEYTYIDQYGMKHTEGPWGGNAGPYVNPINLKPGEFVKEVSGTIGQVNGSEVVSSLKFVTNLDKTYGPFGKSSGNPFRFPEKAGGSVVGFVARTGEYVNAIGVLMRP